MKKKSIKYVVIGVAVIVTGILSFFVYQSYAYFKVNYTGKIVNAIVGEFELPNTLASEPLSSPTSTSIFWGGPIGRDTVETISFTTTNEASAGVIGLWDAGLKKNGKVMAWYTDINANGKYEVVAGAEGGVYAPKNSSSLFNDFRNIDSINFTNLNTSRTTNMAGMFSFTGWSSTVFTLDLGNSFDTGNVTNMSTMFQSVGFNSTVFTLDLGDKFDTSNVTNMNSMFIDTGPSSTIFTLDLGDKFDTSNVTNMQGMFSAVGFSSIVFTLDLGNKFDTSNVTNMSWMFAYTGYANPNFILDLRNNFNVGAVTGADKYTLVTGKATHKLYASDSNISFMSDKGFTGKIINCTTSPALCP